MKYILLIICFLYINCGGNPKSNDEDARVQNDQYSSSKIEDEGKSDDVGNIKKFNYDDELGTYYKPKGQISDTDQLILKDYTDQLTKEEINTIIKKKINILWDDVDTNETFITQDIPSIKTQIDILQQNPDLSSKDSEKIINLKPSKIKYSNTKYIKDLTNSYKIIKKVNGGIEPTNDLIKFFKSFSKVNDINESDVQKYKEFYELGYTKIQIENFLKSNISPKNQYLKTSKKLSLEIAIYIEDKEPKNEKHFNKIMKRFALVDAEKIIKNNPKINIYILMDKIGEFEKMLKKSGSYDDNKINEMIPKLTSAMIKNKEFKTTKYPFTFLTLNSIVSIYDKFPFLSFLQMENILIREYDYKKLTQENVETMINKGKI